MADHLVFTDIETGGPDKTRHPIIQIACVAYHPTTGSVVSEWEQKIQFSEDTCDPEALKTNCYDADQWKASAVPLHEALQNMCVFLGAFKSLAKISKAGRPYSVAQIVAHNAEFEADFLISACQRRAIFFPADYRMLCTKQLAMWTCRGLGKMPEPPSYQLSDLHKTFFNEPADLHDALNDAKACLRVYKRLLEILAGGA